MNHPEMLKTLIAGEALDAAISAAQEYVRRMRGTKYAVSPEAALKAVQDGLADAQALTWELATSIFTPEEIARQKQKKTE
jgi:hypothetical protein